MERKGEGWKVRVEGGVREERERRVRGMDIKREEK